MYVLYAINTPMRVKSEFKRRAGFLEPDPILTAYLADIRQYPLMSDEEVRAEAEKIRPCRERYEQALREKRDASQERNELSRATQTLIQANLKLVVFFAKKFAQNNIHFDIMDLVQAGNAGLMRAAEHYDPGQGAKFTSYFAEYIKGKIKRHIADNSRTIRLPVHIHEKIGMKKKFYKELKNELGRAPTPQELANRLDISLDKLQRLERWERMIPISLTEFTADESVTFPQGNLDDPSRWQKTSESLIDPTQDTFRNFRRTEFGQEIRSALRTLSPRAENIIKMRFGLGDGVEHTLGSGFID